MKNKRKCIICNRKISKYNKTNQCSFHMVENQRQFEDMMHEKIKTNRFIKEVENEKP